MFNVRLQNLLEKDHKMKKIYQPTPEQIAKRAKLRDLCKQIAAMSPEQRAALAAQAGGNILTCEGRQLSEHNCALIAAQGGAGCTIVGGFQQWRKQGRHVKAGEHGFSIWIPCNHKKETGANLAEDAGSMFFIMRSIFDVSQTAETVTAAPAAPIQAAPIPTTYELQKAA
jgi:hypothetical protein